MNIKKIVAGVFACCVVGGIFPSVEKPTDNTVITATASNETGYPNWKYKEFKCQIVRDYVEITSCDKSVTEVVIPAEIEGLPVTKILNGAFAGCDNLTSIEIPDSVTHIGSNVFEGCNNLTSIKIPDSVVYIGSNTFAGCGNLISIDIPNSVTEIAKDAFLNTPWLESKQKENPFVIVNGILIDATTYSGNEIIIPDNVTIIGDFAFSQRSDLTSIEIPDSVIEIGGNAFEGCSSLASIEIPDSVTHIRSNAFEGCSSLTSIEIPDSVIYIGDMAFKDCNNLTSIKILSTDCYIHDMSKYFNHAKVIGDMVTIYGYDKTSAQKYAEEFGNEFVSLGEAPTTSGKLEVTLFGDANCDGRVTIADATAIIQHLGNEDEYCLSAQGLVNADCYNPGDGISGQDALAIKMIESGLIDSLPFNE